MKIDLNKIDLINLVTSQTPDSIQQCDDYTKQGLMKFTGNQWNEKWSWMKDELEKLSETKLWDLYKKHSKN